ncbi:hypothetical protein PR202_ga11480 [Eleusine coracana subsp. coracana]|uniref:Phosphoribosyltransferase domain-containing protein n=1 Tax=Eleusine coracana subsp. coracana TaxID=191504 RepID=A0AAV5C9K9_ELECO|nr:hypothetical protein PR202_ga11480 [Eleusine coracana subsp. coracana]
MANMVTMTALDSGILARLSTNPAPFQFHSQNRATPPPPAHQHHRPIKSPALRPSRHRTTLAPSPAAAVTAAVAMVSAEAGIERVLWTEAEVAARVREVAAELAADLQALPEPPVVVGVATGALLFLADLVRRVDAPLAVDFVRVESYGAGTESSGAPRITSDLKVDVAGKHVVVCPDYFVVGYGMDYAELYRNLPYVGVLKPEMYNKDTSN